MFDVSQLDQFSCWDETHPPVQAGGLFKNQKCLRFRRDPNGRLDSKNGDYARKKQWSKFKYGNEIRISCGCALRKKPDGSGYTGHRLATFDYTGCWIHTLEKYNGLYVPAQIHRIKTGSSRGWTEGVRTDGDGIFMEDVVTRIKGLKKAKADKLSTIGVTHVKHLFRSIEDAALRQQILSIRGIGKPTLRKWQDAVRDAKDGAYVSRFVDHRLAENPYLSKYGDQWEKHIAEDLRKSPHHVVCVKELVWHMYNESRKFFGHDDFFFFHDALTQLTDKQCRSTWTYIVYFLVYTIGHLT